MFVAGLELYTKTVAEDEPEERDDATIQGGWVGWWVVYGNAVTKELICLLGVN